MFYLITKHVEKLNNKTLTAVHGEANTRNIKGAGSGKDSIKSDLIFLQAH